MSDDHAASSLSVEDLQNQLQLFQILVAEKVQHFQDQKVKLEDRLGKLHKSLYEYTIKVDALRAETAELELLPYAISSLLDKKQALLEQLSLLEENRQEKPQQKKVEPLSFRETKMMRQRIGTLLNEAVRPSDSRTNLSCSSASVLGIKPDVMSPSTPAHTPQYARRPASLILSSSTIMDSSTIISDISESSAIIIPKAPSYFPDKEDMSLDGEEKELRERRLTTGELIEEEGVKLAMKGDKVEARAGTPYGLVLYLCSNLNASENFTAFLLTYHGFMTRGELLDILVDFYQNGIPSVFPTTEDAAIRKRLRLCNFMKHWVSHFGRCDFGGTTDEAVTLREKFNAFVSQYDESIDSFPAKLKAALDVELMGGRMGNVVFPTPPPPPILPRRTPFGLLDLSPEEIARQMTIMEYEAFCRIQPKECLLINKAQKNTPSIKRMITRFNEVCLQIAYSITSEENFSRRAMVLEQWLKVMKHLNRLNNFSGLMQVISGVLHTAVTRMKKTWMRIKRSRMKAVNEIRDMMSPSSNYKAYRNEIQMRNTPLIPHLGVYFTDLTYISEATPSTNSDGTVNFTKRKQQAAVILDLMQYQQAPYNLEPNKAIQDFLNESCLASEDECFRFSLLHEPRVPRPSPQRE
eukprot:CAMPEP_0177632484 /NCGR_PEP_ID=MMETSP0447-20121125/2318_1 /TAXON_ID=0 /ORGANISM="Stygamoeba regulata, Strain BSH-02190019" /LENGTH=635 /DNA_ID=CAMNT_0019134059 /DNA_START=171 /DNA_END=2078 /DNA_ORIENTATION=+